MAHKEDEFDNLQMRSNCLWDDFSAHYPKRKLAVQVYILGKTQLNTAELTEGAEPNESASYLTFLREPSPSGSRKN